MVIFDDSLLNKTDFKSVKLDSCVRPWSLLCLFRFFFRNPRRTEMLAGMPDISANLWDSQ